MTSLTTKQMTGYLRTWLATQTGSIPRDILQQLCDMSVVLLGSDNPPNNPTATGSTTLTTLQLLDFASKWLDGAAVALTPKEFLVQIKDATAALLQLLPKWKCSMFFKGADGNVDSPLGFASIDTEESDSHRKFACNAIRKNGGDTLLFIAERMFNNPVLTAAVDASLVYAVSIGMKHVIIDIKNDNQNFSWNNMEAFIRQLVELYAFANSEQVAFMTCLETDEILSVEQTRQMVRWCKKYAPLKRVIVGSANSDFLKSIGTGAELWLEIHTNPFSLSQGDVDKYLSNLHTLLPYGEVWAGEYWDGSSPFSKQISQKALEMGCSIGSWVG